MVELAVVVSRPLIASVCPRELSVPLLITGPLIVVPTMVNVLPAALVNCGIVSVVPLAVSAIGSSVKAAANVALVLVKFSVPPVPAIAPFCVTVPPVTLKDWPGDRVIVPDAELVTEFAAFWLIETLPPIVAIDPL